MTAQQVEWMKLWNDPVWGEIMTPKPSAMCFEENRLAQLALRAQEIKDQPRGETDGDDDGDQGDTDDVAILLREILAEVTKIAQYLGVAG